MEACSVVLAEVNEYLISFAFISIFKKKKSKDSCRNICRVQIFVYAFMQNLNIPKSAK